MVEPDKSSIPTLQQYMSYMNLIQPRWHTLKKIKSQLQFYNPSITKIKTKLIYNWANSIYWSNQHPNLSCVSVFVRRGHFLSDRFPLFAATPVSRPHTSREAAASRLPTPQNTRQNLGPAQEDRSNLVLPGQGS